MTDTGAKLRPANQVPFDHVSAVLAGLKCHGDQCFCQRFRIPTRHWKSVTDQTRAADLMAQCAQGQGVVAYVEDQPVGWCSVAPRVEFAALLSRRMLWRGRTEDVAAVDVWAIACFAVAKGFRKHGLTRDLIMGAVDLAQAAGASRIEGYPMLNPSGETVAWGEMHVGSYDSFAANGFIEVSRPSKRRVVMSRRL